MERKYLKKNGALCFRNTFAVPEFRSGSMGREGISNLCKFERPTVTSFRTGVTPGIVWNSDCEAASKRTLSELDYEDARRSWLKTNVVADYKFLERITPRNAANFLITGQVMDRHTGMCYTLQDDGTLPESTLRLIFVDRSTRLWNIQPDDPRCAEGLTKSDLNELPYDELVGHIKKQSRHKLVKFIEKDFESIPPIGGVKLPEKCSVKVPIDCSHIDGVYFAVDPAIGGSKHAAKVTKPPRGKKKTEVGAPVIDLLDEDWLQLERLVEAPPEELEYVSAL